MEQKFTAEQYSKYVGERTPKSRIVRDTVLAFLIGGTICVIAQIISECMKRMGVDEETTKTALPIIMVFLGAFLTGIGVYEKIAKYGGAGTLVPITGFANAIVSPAMEFKSEGLVMGLAAKMFVVAGPVIVYGTLTSFVVGLVKYILNLV